MRPTAHTAFPEIVERFLEQWCDTGTACTVSDQPLCTKFQAFCTRLTIGASASPLLDTFRIELARRGYQLVEGKRRYWCGLTLRKRWKKPVVAWPARHQQVL